MKKRVLILFVSMFFTSLMFAQDAPVVVGSGGGTEMPTFESPTVSWEFDVMEPGDRLEVYMLEFITSTSGLKQTNVLKHTRDDAGSKFVEVGLTHHVGQPAIIMYLSYGVKIALTGLSYVTGLEGTAFPCGSDVVGSATPLALFMESGALSGVDPSGLFLLKEVTTGNVMKFVSDNGLEDESFAICYYNIIRQ